MDKFNLEGIIVPILTPIDESESPVLTQLSRLTDYVIEGGVDAIFASGTTGEFARFSKEQRNACLKTIVAAAKDRVPVIAGVSDCGTHLVLENIRQAEDLGAKAVVTTFPYYFPTSSKKEQIDFLEEVTSKSNLPVILYNIPAATGVCVGEEVLDQISVFENLYGIKDTSGKHDLVKIMLGKYHDKLKIYVGDERLCAFGLELGADGLVPSLANPFPALLARVWQAAKTKDWELCEKECAVVDYMNTMNAYSDSWMSPNIWRKEALNQMGIMNANFTRPYIPLSDADKEKVTEFIALYREKYSR